MKTGDRCALRCMRLQRSGLLSAFNTSLRSPRRHQAGGVAEVCARGCARQDHVIPSGIAAYAPAALHCHQRPEHRPQNFACAPPVTLLPLSHRILPSASAHPARAK